jgi:2-oxoisovalerate dehydrogenase E1 component
VRFLGHAGSDAEIAYRRARAIEADYDRDPLLATARALVAAGAEPAAVLDRYAAIRTEIDREVGRLAGNRQLSSAAEVTTHSLRAVRRGSPRRRRFCHVPAEVKPRTLAESINATLDQILAVDRRVIIFGEDVGTKGGVYGVTGGLARRHGTRASSTPCWTNSRSWA